MPDLPPLRDLLHDALANGIVWLIGIVGGLALSVSIWAFRRFSPKVRADGSKLTVVICSLEHDVKDRNLHHIVQSLRESIPGIDLITVREILPAAVSGAARDAEVKAHQTAARILHETKGDILISGTVARGDEAIRLRITTRTGDGTNLTGWRLTEMATLPLEFHDLALGPLLASMIAQEAGAAYGSDTFVAATLRPLEAKLLPIVSRLPEFLRPDLRGRILSAHAAIEHALGKELADPRRVQAAIQASEQAAQEFEAAGDLASWISESRNAAVAYSSLAAVEPGTTHLVAARDRLTHALSLASRSESPLPWAALMMTLGNVLMGLGQREIGQESFSDGIQAYQDALEVLDPDTYPNERFGAICSLGCALQTVGLRRRDTGLLRQAEGIFRDALRVTSRSAFPLRWAGLNANLACTLQNLAQVSGAPDALRQARAIFEDVLTATPREQAPGWWAKTKHDLGIVLTHLGLRESGPETLEKAILSFEDALQVRSPERNPMGWAETQVALAGALAQLALRTNRHDYAQRAIAEAEAVFHVYRQETHPLQWALAQAALGSALNVCAAHGTQPDAGPRAVQAFGQALRILTYDQEPRAWSDAMGGLGNALFTTADSLSGEERVRALQRCFDALDSALGVTAPESEPFKWAGFVLMRGLSVVGLAQTGHEIPMERSKIAEDLRVAEDIFRESGFQAGLEAVEELRSSFAAQT